MKKFDNIENLFIEELEDFAPSLSLDEIEMMDKIIVKNNFYKFSPYRFNVYYAAAILTCLFINTIFIYNYIYTQETPTYTEEIIEIGNNQEIVKKSSQNQSDITKRIVINKIIRKATNPLNTSKDHLDKPNNFITTKNSNDDNSISFYTPVQNETNNNNNLLGSSQNQISSQNHADTIHVNSNTQYSQKSIIKTKAPKNIVYIARKDTIVHVDTVKTGRRRKK